MELKMSSLFVDGVVILPVFECKMGKYFNPLNSKT
jgi:hypothetical protein